MISTISPPRPRRGRFGRTRGNGSCGCADGEVSMLGGAGGMARASCSVSRGGSPPCSAFQRKKTANPAMGIRVSKAMFRNEVRSAE
jgi:hypothetical protein